MEATPNGSMVEFDLRSVTELRVAAERRHDHMWAAVTEAAFLPLAKKEHMKADEEVRKKDFDFAGIGLDLDDVCNIGARNCMKVERIITIQQRPAYGPRGGYTKHTNMR